MTETAGARTPSAGVILRTRGVAPMLLTNLTAVLAAIIQITALGKVVYDITGRDLDLGLLGLAEFAPALLLMTVSGTFADRFDRRRVIAAGLSLEVVCSLVLAWYIASGATATVPIFAMVAVFGVGRAFVAPSLRAMPADLAPDGGLPRVSAFSVACWQSAAIVGPVAAGFLYTGAAWWPFLASAAFAAMGMVLIGFTPRTVHSSTDARTREAAFVDLADEYRPAESLDTLGEERASERGATIDDPVARRRGRLHETFEGFRVIRRNPALLGAISLDLFAVLFGGAVALLPAIAEKRLGVDAVGLGWLRAAGGIGAAMVTIAVSTRPIRRHVGPVMFGAVAVFGVFTIVLGVTSSFVIAFVAMFGLSAADSVSVFVRSTLVPLVTPSSARGRVMAVEGVFIGASNELGAFESGVAGQVLGTGTAVVLGGVATLAIVGGWILMFPVLWRFDRFPDRPPD
ncbi:MAG: MFS transporter [Acidimicrobiia bacterium]|nr:MFS transporter [Acidimicrobiia bacterium]